MSQANPTEPKKGMSALAIVLIILGALGVLVVAGIGVMAALAVYGTRKYIDTAKQAEGRMGVTMLARGMERCFEDESKLPPTARPVPATLAAVSGKKYQSSPSDWSDAAYKCAHFEGPGGGTPQYFQYAWTLTDATHGTARAVADLDGDGKADADFSATVSCVAGGDCTVSPVSGTP